MRRNTIIELFTYIMFSKFLSLLQYIVIEISYFRFLSLVYEIGSSS